MPVTLLKSRWVSGNLEFYGAGEMRFGQSANTAGSGIALSSTKTAAFRVYGDDGGVALTAGSYRALQARNLIATAIASGDISDFGLQGQLKIVANVASGGNIAGVWGYLETSGTISVGSNLAGVYAMADAPTGVTIASGAVLAGVQIGSNDLSGTHTGKAAAIHTPNPVAGTWDYFLVTGGSSGYVGRKASDYTPAQPRVKIKCYDGTQDFWIVGYTTEPT